MIALSVKYKLLSVKILAKLIILRKQHPLLIHIRKAVTSNKSLNIIHHIIYLKISASLADVKGLHTCPQGVLSIHYGLRQTLLSRV